MFAFEVKQKRHSRPEEQAKDQVPDRVCGDDLQVGGKGIR